MKKAVGFAIALSLCSCKNVGILTESVTPVSNTPAPTATPTSGPSATPSPFSTPSPQPSASPGATPTVHLLTPSKGDEIYRPNGQGLENWRPGDEVRIPAGNYSIIDIGNFCGAEGKPIVIRNTGGQVRTNLIRLRKACHFKFLGDGVPSLDYGIKVIGPAGVGVASTSSDFEIARVEVTGVDAGFMFKMDPVLGDSSTQYPNYVMKNLYIHHNYIHDVSGEGMYIGHTYPSGDVYHNNLIPIRLDRVEISHNIVTYTGWDGIQLSNARTGAKIHHNHVQNFGTSNIGSQQAGIILGGNTTGDVYDNVVKQGTGNGLEAFGYGTIRFLRNHVEDAGYDGTQNGQDSIYCNDRPVEVESNPKQKMIIENNTILRPKPRGAVRIAASFNNTELGSVSNNVFQIPNAPVDWLTKYVICSGLCTMSGNTLQAP